jgi:hypothetical protein
VPLDGATFRISFRWNDRSGWYYAIHDTAGVSVVGPRRLALGINMLKGVVSANRPRGRLVCLSSSGDEEAALEDLGGRVALVYYSYEAQVDDGAIL